MLSPSREIKTVKHRLQETVCILKLGQESATDCPPPPPPPPRSPLPSPQEIATIINCAVTRNMQVNLIMKSQSFYLSSYFWSIFPLGRRKFYWVNLKKQFGMGMRNIRWGDQTFPLGRIPLGLLHRGVEIIAQPRWKSLTSTLILCRDKFRIN